MELLTSFWAICSKRLFRSRIFREADAEFDTCLTRKGEAIELFTSNVPTYAWLPPVYYDQGLARQGMKNAAFADSFKQYLAIRGQSTEDPHLAEIRQQLH